MKHKKRLFAALLVAVFALVSILAACSTKTAIVTFDSAGGSSVAAVTVSVGETVSEPQAPIREGYTFAGWYSDNGYTTRYDFTSPVASDMTLYAKWVGEGETPDGDKPERTVAFNTNGGTPLLPTVSVLQGDSVPNPGEPTRNGYSFAGWYLDPSFTTEATFPFAPNKNSVLYAKWDSDSSDVTVQFYYCFQEKDSLSVNHGVPFPVTDKTLTVKAGDKIEQPENPEDFELDGKPMTFSFWCFESTWAGGHGTQPVLFPYLVPENKGIVTLYAAFVEKRSDEQLHSLTFHRGDGEKNTVMYNYAGESLGSKLDDFSGYQPVFSGGTRAEPLLSGYKATGYYKTEEFTADNRCEIPFVLSDADSDVYIRWERQNDLTASFDSQGATNVESVSFPYNGTVEEPETPVKKGFIFDGWFKNKKFDANENRWNFETDTAVKDVTLYAKWVQSPITVGFRTNGGMPVASVSLNADGAISTLPKAARMGTADTTYNFHGWYRDEALTTPVTLPFSPAGNTTLYAKWSAPIALSDFILTNIAYDGGAYAVSLTKEAKETVTDIEIPDSYLGVPVVVIQSSGFSAAKQLKSVVIPDSVTNILRRAFAECASLETVTGLKNVKFIYEEAFRYCVSLKSVDYPKNILKINCGIFSDVPQSFYDNVLQIENDGVYWGNYFLGMKYNVNIIGWNSEQSRIQSKTGVYQVREGTYVIADEAFKYMSKLTEIQLPETVDCFGNAPFSNCYALTKVNIPLKFMKNYGANPFLNCKSMKEISVPEGFNELNKRYVYTNGCLISTPLANGGTYVLEYALPTTTELPNYVNVIGKQSLNYNLSKKFTIPNSVTSIGDWAFQTSSLEEIKIPDSVGILGKSAFYSCTNLKSLTFGANVPKPNDTFFTDIKSKKMSSIEVSPQNAVMSSEDGVVYDKRKTKVLYCAPVRSNPVYSMPESVVSIVQDAFASAKIEVFQSMGAKRIHEKMFENNPYLREVYLSYQVEEIGESAFHNCPKLEIVSMTSNLKIIGQFAFQGCTKLTNLRFYEGLESIGKMAFQRSGLAEANLPDSVKSVGAAAFERCANLKTLHFGAGVSEIGSNYGTDFAGILNLNLESLTVSESNEHFSAQDLILYNKDKSVLLSFPQPMILSLNVPDTVKELNLNLITNNDYVESVSFGKSVFTNCATMDEIVAQLKILQNMKLGWAPFQSFCISEDHPLLYSRNNLIYTKDKTKILARAPFLNEDIVLPKETTEIPEDIFSGSDNYFSGDFDDENAISLSCEADSQLHTVAKKAFYTQKPGGTPAAFFAKIDFQNAKLLSSLGDSAFEGLYARQVLFASDAPLTYLPEKAFYNSAYTTEIRLPNAVAEFRALALAGTYVLKTLNVPNALDVTKIAERAFWYSGAVTKDKNGAEYWNDYLISVSNTKDTVIIVKDGTTAILPNALKSICTANSACEKIYLPASVRYAGATEVSCDKDFEILSLAPAPASGDVPNGWDEAWIPDGNVTVTWGATLPAV